MGLLEKFSDNGSFTRSQKAIALYMQENVESVAFCTLSALAEKLGVSTTTIIRFSRVTGFSGFTDMQQAVKDEIQGKTSLPERLESMGNIRRNELLKESFAVDEENIRMTLLAQNNDDLQKVVQSIQEAKKVFLLGMRSSFALAHYMATRLGEIKKNVHLIQSTGMLYPEEIVDAQENDVCIAYFFPRYSKIAGNIITWLRKQRVCIILFTSMNNLAAKRFGNIILPCEIKSISYKNSLTAPTCLTNYLIAELAKENFDEAKEVLSRTEDILSTGYYLGL